MNLSSFSCIFELNIACGHLCCVHLAWLLRPGGGPYQRQFCKAVCIWGWVRFLPRFPRPLSWATYYVDWFHFLPSQYPRPSTSRFNLPKCLELFFQGRMKSFCSSFILLGAIFLGRVPRDLRGESQSKVIIAHNEVTSCLRTFVLC